MFCFPRFHISVAVTAVLIPHQADFREIRDRTPKSVWRLLPIVTDGRAFLHVVSVCRHTVSLSKCTPPTTHHLPTEPDMQQTHLTWRMNIVHCEWVSIPFRCTLEFLHRPSRDRETASLNFLLQSLSNGNHGIRISWNQTAPSIFYCLFEAIFPKNTTNRFSRVKY